MKRKKFFALFLTVFLVSANALTALAGSNCLDVRDYGDHRYQARYYGVVSSGTYEEVGFVRYDNATTRIDVYYFENKRWGCVCGAETIKKDTYLLHSYWRSGAKEN